MKTSREFDAIARSYLRLLRDTLRNVHYRPKPQTVFSEAELQVARDAIESVKARYGQLLETKDIPQSQEVHTVLTTANPEMICATLSGNRAQGHTLLDESSMDNVEFCARNVLARDIPGDFVECGVFRGGTVIFMRGILKAWGDKRRTVWVADSFEGLPDPDPWVSPLDAIFHEYIKLVGKFDVSVEAVKDNFKLYDLLDQQVQFLPGWFCNSLPSAPIEQISLLRMDADYYESTVDILNSLYPKVSVGGMVIVDDYGAYLLGARRAVNEYRAAHGITSPLIAVNGQVVFWQKQ